MAAKITILERVGCYRNWIFLNLQDVRRDGYSQVRVQSTKVRPRTGLERGNGYAAECKCVTQLL